MHSAKNKELRENVIDRARTMYAMLCIRLVEIFSERLYYILRCAAILNNDVAIKHRFSQTMSFLTSASSLSQLYAVYIRETATIITTQISRCYAAEPEEPLWCVIKQSSKRERGKSVTFIARKRIVVGCYSRARESMAIGRRI